MKSIELIKKLLNEIPELNFEEEDNYISVSPSDKNGFTVWISIEKNNYTVGYDGWHEEFEDENDAFGCFIYGLTNKCRLKVFKRGEFTYNWTMEAKGDGFWKIFSSTTLLFFPFWRKREIVFLQNNYPIENQIQNFSKFPPFENE